MEEILKCRICGNTEGNNKFVAREMMFGTKEEFEYFQCANCGCIQIKEIPQDLGKYYPEKYNAFDRVEKTKDSFIKSVFKKIMAKHYLTENKNPLGKFLLKKFDPGFLPKVKKTGANFNTAILDVGSGSGYRLVGLARFGFKNLTGIDPFIKEDIYYNNGVRIFKQDIYNFKGKYDLVMLNHVFEHMPEPFSVMGKIRRLLKDNAFALIRIPVAGSYSQKEYGVNWVGMDPPRHLFIHTKKSIEILAGKSGFELTDVCYDSSEFQFLASEQYKRGIPLRSENSFYDNPDKSIFTKEQIAEYRKKAEELNKKGEGDAACFYLKKVKEPDE